MYKNLKIIAQQHNMSEDELGYYITGFVEGEGNFNLYIRNRKKQKGIQVHPRFCVVQTDIEPMRMIKDCLGCGGISIKKQHTGRERTCYALQVGGKRDCYLKIIPFFDKYGFTTKRKQEEYRIWKEGVCFIQKSHLTKEDIEKVDRIIKRKRGVKYIVDIANKRISNVPVRLDTYTD